jgi:hypothetical protein
VTDAQGVVTLSLKPLVQDIDSYFGYLLIQGDAVPDTRYCFFPPVGETTFTNRTIVTKEFAPSVLGAPELEFDPERGWIAVRLSDCFLKSARDLTARAIRRVASSIFRRRSRNPNARHTDDSGLALILNLPDGLVHLKVRRGDEQIGSARMQVRGGSVTAAIVPPTPLDE